MVDYCLVPTEDLDVIDGFTIETMLRCEARLCKGDRRGLATAYLSIQFCLGSC